MKMILSESEKKDILSLYDISTNNVAIVEALSLQENYVIFLDNLYDVKQKKLVGNIWESFDRFKLFFNDTPKNLNESLLEFQKEINSFVLLENKTNLQILKSQFILMNEQDGMMDKITGGIKSFGNWATQKGKEAIQGTKDVVNKTIQGAKDFANKFSQGEWMDALSIVKKGVVYLARKLRDALYHPVGMILDAILVASGIGKTAQFVIWAIVVVLDIYELVSGDYPEGQNLYSKLLFTGVDILGLVFAGVAAKGAKGVVGNFVRSFGKSAETMRAGIKQSPKMQGLVKQMGESLNKVPSLINQASQYLAKKAPSIHKWISGLMSGVSKFLKKIADFLAILGQGTIKAGGKVLSAPGKAIQKGVQKLGASTATAAKTSAIATGGGLTAGLAYAMDKPQGSDITFDNAEFDFSQGL